MENFKTKNQHSLFDYLKNNEQNELFVLSEEISFHWANWDETSRAMKALVESGDNTKLLAFLDDSLNVLKQKPIWLCNKMKSIKTTYYALYESYLDSRLRLTWFDRDEEILYSDSCEQGPFSSLSSMKWFSKEFYEKFIQRKILSDRYPLRSFRITTEINLSMKFDNHYVLHNQNVKIHQLSEAGVLLRIKDRNFINKIKNSHHMEIDFPIFTNDFESLGPLVSLADLMNAFKLGNKESSLKFTINSDVINQYSNLQNSKRSAVDEFYIFARYEDFRPVDHQEEMKSLYFGFVTKFKRVFLEQLKQCGLVNEAEYTGEEKEDQAA